MRLFSIYLLENDLIEQLHDPEADEEEDIGSRELATVRLVIFFAACGENPEPMIMPMLRLMRLDIILITCYCFWENMDQCHGHEHPRCKCCAIRLNPATAAANEFHEIVVAGILLLPAFFVFDALHIRQKTKACKDGNQDHDNNLESQDTLLLLSQWLVVVVFTQHTSAH